MFVPILFLASLAVATQDAPAEETPTTVRSFLIEADARIYHPEDHGLETLEFVRPIGVPADILASAAAQTGMTLPVDTGSIVRLGAVRVVWSQEGEPEFLVSESENLSPEVRSLATMMGMTRDQFPSAGLQALTTALNRLVDFESMLTTFDATLEETDQGMVKVVFTPKPAMVDQVPTVAWYFEQDGTPVRSVIEVPQENMLIVITSTHEWTETDNGQLIVSRTAVDQDQRMAAMPETSLGGLQQETRYIFQDVDGIPILVAFEEKMTQGEQSLRQRVDLGEIVANGTSVGGS